MDAVTNSNNLDWSSIRTIDDLWERLGDAKLYDDSISHMDVTDDNGLELADDLTPYEIEDAMRWAQFSRGVILISGKVGSGKSCLLHILAWKFARYFRRTVILDQKPRRAFGYPYILYTPEFLYEMCQRLAIYTAPDNSYPVDATRWITDRGEIFLRRAVVGLDEAKRYLPRVAPNDSVSQMWLSLFTIWRHLDSVIIACCTKREDITPHCYPELTAEISVRALPNLPGTSLAIIYPLRYNVGTQQFNIAGRPIPVVTQMMEPISADRHPTLAGCRWVDIYNSWNAQTIRVPKAFEKRITKRR